MDNKVEPTKKRKKTINNLPNGIYNRLQFIVEFEEDSIQFTTESILESYDGVVLSSCSTFYKVPANPLDIVAFESTTKVPGSIPHLRLPILPRSIPLPKKKGIFVQPKYPSLIPLLMTAKFSKIDTSSYHIVTQRNSLRKLAMNDESFVLNVVRFGSTLYLRRFAKYRTVDKNNVGFRFEEMCTDPSNRKYDFNQLIRSRIGQYEVLMMCETDAINERNESVELKCKKSDASKSDELDWWLQAHLSKYQQFKDNVVHVRDKKNYRWNENDYTWPSWC